MTTLHLYAAGIRGGRMLGFKRPAQRSLALGPQRDARQGPRRRSQRPRRTGTDGSRLAVCSAEVLGAEKLSLELPTPDVQKSLELTALRRRRGGNIVIVLDCTPGSDTWAAGVRPGQQLLAVSDPIRAGEVWELNGLASLKYVRQAIKGRGLGSISLTLSAEPVPEWGQALAAARTALGMADAATEELSAVERTEVAAQLDRMQEAAQQAKQASREEKLNKRRAYEEENRQRESSKPLFAGIFVGLFLVLPLAILAAAKATGFLDRMY